MEPAQPLRFGGVVSKDAARVRTARKLTTRQGGRLQKPKRPEQQPLARSSQQPAASGAKSNRGGARQRELNLSQKKGKKTPTFTLFPPRAAQKVAARKPSSQIQARTTPRFAKMSVQAAKVKGKRLQPLAQKPGVAQKRRAKGERPCAK